MKIHRTHKLLMFLVAVLLLAMLPGCTTGSKPVAMEGVERDQVLAKAEPIADRMFQAMKAHNYAGFAKDFDAAMQKAMPETGFNQMMQTLDAKIGMYQSRQVAKVERVGNYIAVTYSARFEQEEAVSWRLMLTPGEPVLVSGFWYDSPKLRTK